MKVYAGKTGYLGMTALELVRVITHFQQKGFNVHSNLIYVALNRFNRLLKSLAIKDSSSLPGVC
ncbi:MAG: hypothetical protein ACTS8H_04200 [Arsenophonus sp. NC-PE1-MAG3]